MLHSIGFSIPEKKITTHIYKKTKIVSNLIPGDISTYIYYTEEEYYHEYKSSYFAITRKKGGWDCLRHYEIIANGCLPYFIDIENCPINTMTLLPKDLLIQSNNLFTKFINKNINELPEEYINEYNILVNKLLNYTRENLTTLELAKYILKKTNFENVSKILFLSGDTNPDYLRCVTLHGFKELLGTDCHDYPKINHIYNLDYNSRKLLYGKGFTYSDLLDHSLHNNELDNTIEENIKNKYYDIVIYGSYHRGMPYYDLVNTIYKPNEIILLCGEDIHVCDNNIWLQKKHNVFVREQ
jgi:hypothetical protein